MSLEFNLEIKPKPKPEAEKPDTFLSLDKKDKKELNQDNFLKNKLYQEIINEIEQVIIKPENYNEKKELLAPNGQVSNLAEKEWKMVRTPSFKKWFGDWEKKYNKEDLKNWMKHQYLKSLEEDSLSYIQRYIENLKEYKLRRLNNNNPAFKMGDEEKNDINNHYGQLIKDWNDQRITILHEISKVQAEIVNKNFNPHLSDYSKILDENGEPLMVWRGTDYAPNDQGFFEIPKLSSFSGEFPVGTFLGKKQEASYHHKNRIDEGKNSFLYGCFVNLKNIKILPKKFDWHSEEEKIKNIKQKYDGMLVKEISQGNEEVFKDREINLLDLVVFDPKNILINKIEQ